MTRTRTSWKVRDHVLTIGERTLIMGVLNVTPDSFSDGGKYLDPDAAAERALEMEAQGADIIDIGAESTKPGSERINAGEELRRLVPVLKRLKGHLSVPISVDTYKIEVAEKAFEHGASIINDVSALTWEPDLAKSVIQNDAGLILNHMRGTPETWARLGPMKDVMSGLLSELEAAIHRASRAGVPRDRIVIDPGIGFGKRGEQNHEILARLGELQKFALPVLVAASRKSFLGNADDSRALEFATAAAVTTAILHGAAIVRVHDVAAMRAAVQAADAILENTPEKEEKPRSVKRRVEETIEEKRRKPVRPTIKTQEKAPKPEEAAAPPPPSEPPPVADEETPAPPPPPRRPFERSALPPSISGGEKKAPTKKFFEWREDRPDKKPAADRRAGPKRDDRDRDDRGRNDRAPRPPFRPDDAPPSGDRPPRRPFQRADGPSGDRPERRPYQRSEGPPSRGPKDNRTGGGDRPARRPFQRADGPSGDRPERRPYQRSEGPPSRGPKDNRTGGGDRPARRPFQRADGPSGDRPERRPYQRSEGPPSRGPKDNRTGGGDRPPRKPFQRADDDRPGGDRPGRRPAGGRPSFSPRDNDRGSGPNRPAGGRPAGPRRDDTRRNDRGDRPPFGGPKRGGGGAGGRPPRGPRKRT